MNHDTLKAHRDWFAARSGSHVFGLAIATRQQLEPELVRAHMDGWKHDPASELDAEDLKQLEEGGSHIAALQELHELSLVKKICESLEAAVLSEQQAIKAGLAGLAEQPPPAAEQKAEEPAAEPKKRGSK